MTKITLACLLVAVVALAAVKILSIPTSGLAVAREAPMTNAAPAALDASAITRAAPHDLPNENWSPN